MNIEITKRIMYEKITFPYLRNQDWKTVMVEIEKQIIITYLNEKHHRIERSNLC